MSIKIWSLALLVCGTVPFVYPDSFSRESVKSHIFTSIRPKHPPKNITECDTVVTEPYGLLQKTYKRAETKEGSSCSWTLRAPANHVVNVISVGFNLTDDISPEKHGIVYSGSHIDLYDSDQMHLTGFGATEDRQIRQGVFLQSISKDREMRVTITWHDVDYATQKIYVKYEFLNVDDMKRLLLARP